MYAVVIQTKTSAISRKLFNQTKDKQNPQNIILLFIYVFL